MKKNIILISLALLMLMSCATMGPGNDVEVFFIDKGKLQYFLPNTPWYGAKEAPSFEGDWLYRSYALEGEEESRTVFNFSIIYDKLDVGNHPLETLFLVSEDGREYEVQASDILFKNEEKDRYTCWISSKDFYEFMTNGDNQSLRLILDGEEFLLESSSAFREHVHYFKQVEPDYQ